MDRVIVHKKIYGAKGVMHGGMCRVSPNLSTTTSLVTRVCVQIQVLQVFASV